MYTIYDVLYFQVLVQPYLIMFLINPNRVPGTFPHHILLHPSLVLRLSPSHAHCGREITLTCVYDVFGTHVHTRAHLHTHAHLYTHAHLHTYVHTSALVCTHTHTHTSNAIQHILRPPHLPVWVDGTQVSASLRGQKVSLPLSGHAGPRPTTQHVPHFN